MGPYVEGLRRPCWWTVRAPNLKTETQEMGFPEGRVLLYVGIFRENYAQKKYPVEHYRGNKFIFTIFYDFIEN